VVEREPEAFYLTGVENPDTVANNALIKAVTMLRSKGVFIDLTGM